MHVYFFPSPGAVHSTQRLSRFERWSITAQPFAGSLESSEALQRVQKRRACRQDQSGDSFEFKIIFFFIFFPRSLPWPVARELMSMSQMSLLYISGIYAYLRNSEPTVNIILLNRVVLYVFLIIVQKI